jgi:hypothetical protein
MQACGLPGSSSLITEDPMSHTDLGQPDLAALRATAADAEFAEAEAGIASACGYPLAGTDPLASLVRDLARSLTEAGYTMNAALGCVLTAFGYQVARFGCGGAWLVTGRRRRGTGAGR